MEPTAKLDYRHRFVPATNPELKHTLLLLHGTGGDEDDLLDLGRMLLPGAALLSPRGKVMENGMPRFFRRLAEGVFDFDDLRLRTGELANFIVAASQVYGFDAHKVIAAGFSNGANIAASLLLLKPGTLAGAALLHPMVPLAPEPLPDLSGTPVFIGASRLDPLIPVPQTEHLGAILTQAKASVTYYWQERGGHSISHEEVRAARDWARANLS